VREGKAEEDMGKGKGGSEVGAWRVERKGEREWGSKSPAWSSQDLGSTGNALTMAKSKHHTDEP